MATSAAAKTSIPITELDNDSLVLRLTFAMNFLSRWLTPIHDPVRLMRAQQRGTASVKDLLIQMRDKELEVFPKVHLIATQTIPDLDRLSAPTRTAAEAEHDRDATPLEIMAEFRRLRSSTCSLLRNLVDAAWQRTGSSRREHDWSVRELAELLAAHDEVVLREMEAELDRLGVRDSVATYAKTPLNELLLLAPAQRRA